MFQVYETGICYIAEMSSFFGHKVQIFSIVVHFISTAFGDARAFGALINSLIKNERGPAVLSIKSCWSQQENADFLRNSDFAIEFLTGSGEIDVPNRDLTNKIWFAVDMNCSKSQSYLSNVNFSNILFL